MALNFLKLFGTPPPVGRNQIKMFRKPSYFPTKDIGSLSVVMRSRGVDAVVL